MKTSKLIMFLAFIFCLSLSETATAAASQSNVASIATVATVAKDHQKFDAKTFKKSIKQQFKKVKKDVKKFLKDQKENASVGKLLLLAIVGLACIGLGAILEIGFIVNIGSLLIVIAIVLWILGVIGVI
jgi:Flp pilus assembly protein TadB